MNQDALCDVEGCENVWERIWYTKGRRIVLCAGHVNYINQGIVPPLRPHDK